MLVLYTLEQSGGPLHGYRIATLLDRFVGPKDAPIDLPTLYSSLLQQKQRGLIKVTFDNFQGRRVRTYALTPHGRRYLKSAKVAWERSASLLGGLLDERDRQRRELELAREVQSYFLPSVASTVGLGLDIAGRYWPAREVGGDYYDVIRVSDSAVALVLGDVSGKGIPAALLMATLRAFVRTQLGNHDQLAAGMSRLNDCLGESCAGNRFASLFYAIHDVKQQDLMFVNAGHPPPVLLEGAASATPLQLSCGGPVLGLLPACRYELGRVPFGAGSVLVAFSDGLTEACNPAGSDWGDERLTAAVCGSRTLHAEALADHLLALVTRFVAEGPQLDDMTLLVARRTEGGLN